MDFVVVHCSVLILYLFFFVQMKVFLAVSALVAVASAAVAPIIIIPSAHLAHGPPDSAIVQTERRGNGFTYSIAGARGIEPVGTVSGLSVYQ